MEYKPELNYPIKGEELTRMYRDLKVLKLVLSKKYTDSASSEDWVVDMAYSILGQKRPTLT